MKPPPLHGINGRLRQHITKVGAAYANRISSPKKMVTEDDYLRGLLHGGRITEDQVKKAIDGYNQIPSSFAWLQQVADSILDRADDVFLVEYGRDPTEDKDFRLNGDYYKICKNLQRNWHHYDADLEKLWWDYQGKSTVVADSTAKIIEEVKYEKLKKGAGGDFWMGIIMLLLAGPYSVVFIAIGVKNQGAWVAAALGFAFIGLSLLMMFSGRPRTVRKEKKIRKCSQCGHEFGLFESSLSCSHCGVRFQGK